MNESFENKSGNLYSIISVSVVFLIGMACFISVICPSIYWLDSGELQAALPEFGIPHSPSFPSYMLITHPITYLPFGDIAFRANLATAVAGAFLGVMVCWFCIFLFKPAKLLEYLVCGLTALCTVVNPFVWFQNLKAEIYSLNMIFLLGVLICGIRIIDSDDRRQVFRNMSVLVVLLGLGFTNHSLLTVHIFPAVGILLLINFRKFKLRELLFFALLFILTASIYLYLPLRSSVNPWMDTGNPEISMNFINAVTRRGTYNRFFGNIMGEWFANLSLYFNIVKHNLSAFVLYLSGIGIVIISLRNFKKSLFLCSAAATNIVITLMNRNFNANPDTGPAYLMLSTVVLLICFGALFYYATMNLLQSDRFKFYAVIPAVVLLIIPVVWIADNLAESGLSEDESAGAIARACLDICEPDSAIFFGMYHNLPFVSGYVQSVEKYRVDVIPVNRSELVYWPGGLQNFAIRYPQMTDPIFEGIFGEKLKYLSARSCRHSEEIPYDEARDLLINNNAWMASEYSKLHDVYWFASEDDHLLRTRMIPRGPMLLLGDHCTGINDVYQNRILEQRIQINESNKFSNQKGAEVLATYYDLLCITMSKLGKSDDAIRASEKAGRIDPTLIGKCVFSRNNQEKQLPEAE